MNDNQQDSEPLLNDADYELLRSDSLLARVGSNNFASLIGTSTSLTAENEDSRQQEQQAPLQHQSQQQEAEIQFILNNSLSMGNHMLLPTSELLPLDETEHCWYNLEKENTDLENPAEDTPVLKPEAPVGQYDGTSSTSFTPDSSPICQVPSLQIWPGQYDFGIFVPVGNKDRNKWCFSKTQNKLYLLSFTAVPIHVKLLQWIDATITITPVFKDSRNRVDPVMPCPICQSKVTSDARGHLVIVEGQECHYKQVSERPVVSLPLHPPPPGEVASTLLIKLTCLTSCIGGPNRRPFCLVFTLHDSSGTVIGRQVLDVKCCKCPSRDMLNEDKAAQKHQHPAQPNNELHPLDRVQALKRSAPAGTTGEKKKRFNIKLEPGTDRLKNVLTPERFVGKVKQYINFLIAEEHARLNQPNILLYSEDEY